MATGHALATDYSLLCSLRACFRCCYADTQSQRRDSSSVKSYGTTSAPPADSDGHLSPRDSDCSLPGHSASTRSCRSVESDESRRKRKSSKYVRNSSTVDSYRKLEHDPESYQDEHSGRTEQLNSSRNAGSAYSYEDQDTSSDSDDEVLRRYQQSMARSQSTQSYTQLSQRSAVSKNSLTGRLTGSKPDMLAGSQTLAAVDDKRDASSSAGYSSAADDPTDKSPSHPTPLPSQQGVVDTQSTTVSVAAMPPGGDGGVKADLVTVQQPPVESVQTYENEAYQCDQDMASSAERIASPLTTTSDSMDDTAHEDRLFDISDLQEHAEPSMISKCGSLEVTFSYDPAHTRMNVCVHRARDIPSKERGGASSVQVRLLLLPAKKCRLKTRIRVGEQPEFGETFSFKVPLEEACNMGVRFRLYGCERMRRERMIGECVIGFASFGLEHDVTMWLALEPRSNLGGGDSKLDIASLARSDSASSTQSMQHGGMPELLIGLGYNGTTGRLSAEIIKGSNFRNMAMNRAPDTYVKLTLMSPNGQEMTRSKTSIRRGQPNPLFKETFMFQVALFQLPDVTLMVSVYNKRSMKRKEMIGWFSLGFNNSGEEELSHWDDMRESKGEQVCRWHVLLEA